MSEVVYFIRARSYEPVDLIKIGWTSNLPSRLSALRSASPIDITLLGTLDGRGGSDEGILHGMFAEQWVRGEWYRPSSGLLDLAANPATYSRPPAPTVDPRQLAALRAARGWTVGYAARELGITNREYLDGESGKRPLELDWQVSMHLRLWREGRPHEPCSENLLRELMQRAERRKQAQSSTDKTLFD